MSDLNKIEKQEEFNQLETITNRFVVIIVVYLFMLTATIVNYLFNPLDLNCDLLTMFTVFFCGGIMLPFGFLCFSFLRLAAKKQVEPMHRIYTARSNFSSTDSDPAFWIGINH